MKGKCAGCRVCRAYLRETGKDRVKHVLSIRWQPGPGLNSSSCTDAAPDEKDIRSAVAELETALTSKGVQVILEIFPPAAACPPRETVSVAGIWISARALACWLKQANRHNDCIAKIKAAAFNGENKPALTPMAERVFTAGLLAAAKLLQTKGENSGCPVAE